MSGTFQEMHEHANANHGPEDDGRCPRCRSPDPARHPAMQFEGEVQICPHPFHGASAA